MMQDDFTAVDTYRLIFWINKIKFRKSNFESLSYWIWEWSRFCKDYQVGRALFLKNAPILRRRKHLNLFISC